MSKVKQSKLSKENYIDLGFGGLASGFAGMLYGGYNGRKVDRYGEDGEDLIIDTAYTNDTGFYEVGIVDTRYRKDGAWIIVDECETKKEAKLMHKKWIDILTSKDLPETIKDIHSEEIYTQTK